MSEETASMTRRMRAACLLRKRPTPRVSVPLQISPNAPTAKNALDQFRADGRSNPLRLCPNRRTRPRRRTGPRLVARRFRPPMRRLLPPSRPSLLLLLLPSPRRSHPRNGPPPINHHRLRRNERRLGRRLDRHPPPSSASSPTPAASPTSPTRTRLRAATTRGHCLLVGEVGLDPAGLGAGALVAGEGGAVGRDGVRLEVEFGFENDELLFETGRVGAEVVGGLVVLLLFRWKSVLQRKGNVG